MEASEREHHLGQQLKQSSSGLGGRPPPVMMDVKSVAGSRGSEGDGAESTNIFKGFPDSLDESTQSSILENIDAAIYENQIIFQERIRKNQLTIQNLKLQDELLSQFMDLSANGLPNTANLQTILMSLEEQRRQAVESFGNGDPRLMQEEGHETMGDPNSSLGYMSTRDYENMCFVNITRNVNKLKHWRNYVQNIQGNQHDGSTAMNSSCFGNTTNTTTTATSTDLAEAKVDDLYMVMQPVNKNILVETINQINDEESSPLKPTQRAGGDEEFDCDVMMIGGGGLAAQGGHKMRKESMGKQVPGLYFYNLNNIPLDSILESNCEDNDKIEIGG